MLPMSSLDSSNMSIAPALPDVSTNCSCPLLIKYSLTRSLHCFVSHLPHHRSFEMGKRRSHSLFKSFDMLGVGESEMPWKRHLNDIVWTNQLSSGSEDDSYLSAVT